MKIFILLWITMQVLLSIWVILKIPPKSLLTKYPYSTLFLGLFNTSVLSRISMDKGDFKIIRKCYLRFRLWCLFTIACGLLFNLFAFHKSSELLLELTQ